MNNKIIYFTLIIVISFGISCSDDANNTKPIESDYINIPDAQFETKLIDLGIDTDGIINKKVLKSDVSNIEFLNIKSQSSSDEISDLTGIEGFTKLKRLYAAMNNLSSINLSENKLLDTLSLEGNYLTTIDLSNNPKLLMLDLKVNDLVSVTGLSAASNLKWLNLSFNLLKKYSIENSSLENILISNNELESLDTSNAINLKSIYIPSNKITQLDFSKNTLLELINIGDNKLSNLNFEQNKKLYYISCFSNSLTNLDVSYLTELNYLSANRNPDLLCIKIKGEQNITTLKLSDNQEVNENCN